MRIPIYPSKIDWFCPQFVSEKIACSSVSVMRLTVPQKAEDYLRGFICLDTATEVWSGHCVRADGATISPRSYAADYASASHGRQTSVRWTMSFLPCDPLPRHSSVHGGCVRWVLLFYATCCLESCRRLSTPCRSIYSLGRRPFHAWRHCAYSTEREGRGANGRHLSAPSCRRPEAVELYERFAAKGFFMSACWQRLCDCTVHSVEEGISKHRPKRNGNPYYSKAAESASLFRVVIAMKIRECTMWSVTN